MADDANKKFGQQWRKVREAQGISQEALAYHTGVARSYLWRIEQGRANPTLSLVEKLPKGLGVTFKELFEGGESSRLPKPRRRKFGNDPAML